jgi:hypothetical protein
MRSRQRLRAALLLAVTALGLAAAAGCGGSEDLTKGLDPAEILGRSRETAAAVRSYHPHLTLTLDLTTAAGPAQGILGRLAGQPVTITADGPVRRPIAEGGPAFAFDLTAELAGFDLQGRITKVGDAVYLSLLGADFQLDLPPEQAQAVRIPPEPALFVDSPTEVGREELDGIPVVHLRGEVATDAVVDYLVGLFQGAPNLLGGRSLPQGAELDSVKEAIRGAVKESSSEVWIGTKDLLPHRVAARLVLEGPLDPLLPGITAATLDVQADVDGFDEQVEIVAPPNPVPFDPSIFESFGL